MNITMDDVRESDCMAVIETCPGALRLEPAFVSSTGTFVIVNGQFVSPETLPGFHRFEKKPQFRERRYLETFRDERFVPTPPEPSLRERIEAQQRQWALKKR